MNGTRIEAPAPGEKTRTISLLIIAIIITGFALYFMRPVLLPLLFAIFLYLCLTPLIDLQVRLLRIPHRIALITTALLGTLALLIVVAVAASALSKMVSEAGLYQQQLSSLIERLSNLPLFRRSIGGTGTDYLRRIESSLGGFISGALIQLSNLVSNGLYVVVITAFILISRGDEQHHGLIAEIEAKVQRYISATVFLSALTGLLTGLALALLGVRYALVFGLMAFLLNFIPVLGPVVATILPLPIAWLSPELSITAKVLVLVIPIMIQFVTDQIISPKVMGRSLALHPVTVLVFLLFFQMIWGIGGAFLSTPIAAVAKILFEHFPATQPLARVMAGDFGSIIARDRANAVIETQS